MQETKVPEDLSKRYLKIFGVVSAYWFISISIVFMNKTLFSAKLFDLKAPLFVTWTQCIVTALICLVWGRNLTSFSATQPFEFRTIKTFLPVALLSVLTLCFGNLSLTFVEISFYLIGRSLTTVFNVIFTYLILNQKTSTKALLCCVGIICGFILGVDQEHFIGSFSFSGTVFGILSSLTLSLYSIFTKKVLPIINNEVMVLTYFNSVYSVFLFLPLIALNGEAESLTKFDFINPTFWCLTILSGVFGFLIGFITTLQIQVTSPLTHNISGTAKACAQTVIATYWFNEVKSFLWWFSNFTVLFSSAMYARVRQLEMKIRS